MTILLFLVVLVALIVVHEFGHLVAAKLCNMRVDEFGIGYPPKALTFYKSGGTDYTLNWLPFGGFVKIYGEDGDEKEASQGGKHTGVSFTKRPKWQQALVLLAGIFMNLVFAWVLVSVAVSLGVPRALSSEEMGTAKDVSLLVSRVVADSPAERAGLMVGDTILSVGDDARSFSSRDAEAFTAFISDTHAGDALSVTVEREGDIQVLTAVPQAGIVPTDTERVALGVGVASVGVVQVPWWEAPIEGARITVSATGQIAVGLAQFFKGLFTFSADLRDVSGPVGIVGAVGDASAHGLSALLMLTAVISINLALINVLPVPALDGGRLLFVAIEAITRKPIPHTVAGSVNALGFALLVLLMLVVTAHDVLKLFS